MNTWMTIIFILAGMAGWMAYVRNKQARKKTISVVRKNCVGCKRCVKTCRHNVLEVVRTPEGPRVTVKAPERCRACGHCVAACPFHALELIECAGM